MEIVQESLLGKSFGDLAKSYGCTTSTISRTVKGLLTKEEYEALKKGRTIKSVNLANNSSLSNEVEQSIEEVKPQNLNNDLLQNEDFIADQNWETLDEEFSQPDLRENNSQENFKEVVPLISEFAWEEQQEVAAKPFDIELFPETVYMLVDKKVELESKPLKDFSQWSFLPDQDQERLAILLFSNQRSAKRHCTRNQRVLKVPNPEVFMISCPFLVSKGITRLVLDDCLIALDS